MYGYHVTTDERIKRIVDEGLSGGHPTAFVPINEETGEYEDDTNYDDVSDTYAEETLNEVLEGSEYRPKKFSRDGVYFWPSEYQASTVAARMSVYNGRTPCIAEVDLSKVADRAYVGDADVTDRIYDIIKEGHFAPDMLWETGEERTEEAVQVDKLAQEYWDSAKPYKVGAKYPAGTEVVVNAVINTDMIKSIIGCDVQNIGAQRMLTAYLPHAAIAKAESQS